jgi:hypothetical protein
MILFSVLIILGYSGMASATLFSIGNGGSFNFGGFGFGNYSVTALTSNFNISAGETSGIIDFFRINFDSFSAGIGNVQASIQLLEPVNENLNDSGAYWGFANGSFYYGKISWNDPVTIGYGNGGLLELDLKDIPAGYECGPLTISGTIKNIADSASVPEPATLFLLGAGLIGIVSVSRKNFLKKK